MRQSLPILFVLSIIYTGRSTTSGLLLQSEISKSNRSHQQHLLYFTRKSFFLPPRHQLQPHQQRTRKSTTTRLRVATAFIPPGFLPLVKANDAWGNWSVLTGTAAIAQVLGKTTPIGRLLGPPVTAMAITFGLATIGVINAGGTAAAKSLQLLALQLATPLILLGADLRDAPRRCGPLLISFVVASSATVIACLLAWHWVGSWLRVALGNHDGLVIAAALMAKNIGGGINYMAVCTSLSASQTAIAAGLCVDNIFALVYFPATSVLAAGRPDVKNKQDDSTTATTTISTTMSHSSTDTDETENHNKKTVETTGDQKGMISVEHVSTVLVLSTTLLWLGEKLGGSIGGGGGASSLPICTLLTVLLASSAPTSWMSPLQPAAHVLGVVCLYLFFATAGAPGLAVADSVKASILPLSAFLGILYSVHGLILVAAHALFGRRCASDDSSRISFLAAAFVPQRLLVASSAAIGGPATAVALAQAASWDSLTAPSLLIGNVGYAIATFLGLLYHAYFR